MASKVSAPKTLTMKMAAAAAKTAAKKAPAKKVPAKKAPAKKAVEVNGHRDVSDGSIHSTAVSASWSNPGVAAARSLRHAVKVGGKEYRSMNAAFADLGLPAGPVIKFRRALVLADGPLKHEGKTFSLVA